MLVRGEVSGKGKRFLVPQVNCNISVAELDRRTSDLKTRTSQGRTYSASSGMN